MGVVFDSGHPEDANEPGGPVFRVERHGDRWVLGFGTPGPTLQRVRIGDRVWVTSDPDVMVATERLRRTAIPRRTLPVDLEVRGAAGRPLWMRARSAGREAVAETATAATQATGAGLTDTVLRDKLGAFGGSDFHLGRLDTQGLAPGLHVPVSELKRARRALVEGLNASPDAPSANVARTLERVDRPQFAFPALAPPDGYPRLVPLCRSPAQLEAAIASGSQEVELDWMEMVGLGAAVTRARAAGLQVTLATLRVQKPGEEAFDGRLARLEPEGVLVRHWGGMVAFARRRAEHPERFARLRIHGDFSLNVSNSITAHHLFGWGLDTLTASHDLDEEQLFALLDNVPAERVEVIVHHRIPTFHTEHCVYAHLLSNGRDDRTCGRPCEVHQIGLQDTSGRVHPVIVDAGCRNTVFNSEVQSAARLVPRLLRAGVRRLRIEFVREDRDEAATVLAQYAALIAGRTTAEQLLVEVGAVPQQGVSRRSMELSR
jgi:putative protease